MTNRPLVVLILAFSAGILAMAFARLLVVASLPLCLLLLGLFWVTRRRFWAGAAVVVAFGLLGAARYQSATFVPANDISHLAPGTVTVTGIVTSDPKVLEEPHPSLPDMASCVLVVRQVTDDADDRVIPATGSVEIRALLPKSDSHTETVPQVPLAGDMLTVHGRLETPSGPRNPGGFDDRAYLARRNVYAILTARRAEDWRLLSSGRTGGNPWDRLASFLRQGILDRIAGMLPPERAAALSGILLGAREDLPPTLQDDFERTGTTHILATAGLHVGLVAGLLALLLRLLRVPMRSRILLLLAALALYATMAGGRPSVTRAALLAAVFLAGF
ncbi:MAG TPA: ComEC/Rec2 family competence protein, partial [Chthonomonadaceae bacterium]|nr:ComEC/Rec2 family competence protein [Chthonomonadaceae bacterium]